MLQESREWYGTEHFTIRCLRNCSSERIKNQNQNKLGESQYQLFAKLNSSKLVARILARAAPTKDTNTSESWFRGRLQALELLSFHNRKSFRTKLLCLNWDFLIGKETSYIRESMCLFVVYEKVSSKSKIKCVGKTKNPKSKGMRIGEIGPFLYIQFEAPTFTTHFLSTSHLMIFLLNQRISRCEAKWHVVFVYTYSLVLVVIIRIINSSNYTCYNNDSWNVQVSIMIGL